MSNVGTARWTARAGAWLGIGTSPGALLMGAEIGAVHDGAAPLLGLALGAGIMVLLLHGQGLLGLHPPDGAGTTLTGALPSYLGPRGRRGLGVLLAASMVGWFGFNVGLGGAATGALLGIPDWVGALGLGTLVFVASLGGMRRWNALAVLTTGSALVLVLVVAFAVAPPRAPVRFGVQDATLLRVDVAAMLGYVSVFSVRAPDFSVGLRSRGDLARCVALLVGSTLVVAVVGVSLQLGTGSTDLVGVLAGREGLALANLFVALAVVAPSFTTTYSGSLALRSVSPWMTDRRAMAVIAALGTGLAVLRFDRQLASWLGVLAAVLPPVLVPMLLEAARRRRHRTPRRVPTWTWAPGAAVGGAVAIVGWGWAVPAGLGTTTLLVTGWWVASRHRTAGS